MSGRPFLIGACCLGLLFPVFRVSAAETATLADLDGLVEQWIALRGSLAAERPPQLARND